MQDVHWMTVCAWEKTVEMCMHPGHLTSMKYEFGACTRRFSLWVLASLAALGLSKSMTGMFVIQCNMDEWKIVLTEEY
jgi:hypothetical protein